MNRREFVASVLGLLAVRHGDIQCDPDIITGIKDSRVMLNGIEIEWLPNEYTDGTWWKSMGLERVSQEEWNESRVSQCSIRPHKPELPSATLGPATG